LADRNRDGKREADLTQAASSGISPCSCDDQLEQSLCGSSCRYWPTKLIQVEQGKPGVTLIVYAATMIDAAMMIGAWGHDTVDRAQLSSPLTMRIACRHSRVAPRLSQQYPERAYRPGNRVSRLHPFRYADLTVHTARIDNARRQTCS
jgi:hypothetical protein